MAEDIELPEEFGKDTEPGWLKDATKGIDTGIAFGQGKKQGIKETFELIEKYFANTLEPDGVIFHHIDDTEWQRLKRQLCS